MESRHLGIARRDHKFLIIECNDDHFIEQLKLGDPLHIDHYPCMISKIYDNTIVVHLSDDYCKKKFFRHFVDHTLVSLTAPNFKTPTTSYEVQLTTFKNGNPLLIHTNSHNYLVILAESLTPTTLLMFHSYGIVHVILEYARASRLRLPLFLINDKYHTTTCDLQGGGPSIADQISTIGQLIGGTGPFSHPGHINPRIVSRYGPLKDVAEVSIALARLVAKIPVTVMVALTNKAGNLMTTAEALTLGVDQKIQSLFLDECIEYLTPQLVVRTVTAIKTVPIENMGTWELLEYPTYRIMIKGNIFIQTPILYIHMACNCIDDILGIDEHGNLLQCACKRRYGNALKRIHETGAGLIIFPKGPLNYSEIILLLQDLYLTDLEVINYQPESLPGFNIHTLKG